jgi:hypothetical protein
MASTSARRWGVLPSFSPGGELPVHHLGARTRGRYECRSRAHRFRNARARFCDPNWVCGACVRARRLRTARAHSHSLKEKKNTPSGKSLCGPPACFKYCRIVILNGSCLGAAPPFHLRRIPRILPDRNSTWPLLESSIWLRSCRPDTPSLRFCGLQAPATDTSPPRLSQRVTDTPVVVVHRRFPAHIVGSDTMGAFPEPLGLEFRPTKIQLGPS